MKQTNRLIKPPYRMSQVLLLILPLLILISLPGPVFGIDQQQAIKNIETFSRLYGYVKYFYPGDEAAATDWDTFAMYGVKKVESAKNSSELKQILEELFLPIAPALVIHESGKKIEFSPTTITPPNIKDMKIIAWQHKGVGAPSNKSIYSSIRLNRKNKISGRTGFGSITGQIDAKPYIGKEIKFRAAVKVESGKGQLWLRIDREGNKRGFFSNMGDSPVVKNEWKYYEIIGTVADDAAKIVFGCFLKGSGLLWADDFKLCVKEGESWKPIEISNPDFEEDKDGDTPKLWKGMKKGYLFTVVTTDSAKGKKCVQITDEIKYTSEPLFERKPNFGEHIVKKLGSDLTCIMPIALYGSDTMTYPKADENRLKDLKTALEDCLKKELTADDLYLRLGVVVISWNNFQHFFPYFDVIKTDWKKTLTETLNDAYRDKNFGEFLLTMQKFTAKLKDGHVSVSNPASKQGRFSIPLKWEWIENSLVITEVLDEKLKESLTVGDVVLQINGQDAEVVFNNQKQYVSAATKGWANYRSATMLTKLSNDNPITLVISRPGNNNTESKTEVQVTPLDRKTYWERYKGKKDEVQKKIKEGVYYLDIRRISMEEIEKLMPELQKATGIICDLRGYPNGNHGIITHLLKENDTSDKWMRVPQVIYPDFEKVEYKNYKWLLPAKEPHLDAKIVFLINGTAISYAESFMSFIEHYKLATIIGQPTAGTNGNVNFLHLPGGFRITWTGMRVLKHDGSQHHGIGILPNIPMEKTIAGVRAGKDEFLEKAIEVVGK